jgi:hypothetical protein
MGVDNDSVDIENRRLQGIDSYTGKLPVSFLLLRPIVENQTFKSKSKGFVGQIAVASMTKLIRHEYCLHETLGIKE